MNANINGSIDIAMGVPSHQYAATFAFYRSVVWLTPITGRNLGHRLCAGPNRIWIDEALQMRQAEIGLELLTDSFGDAVIHLARSGVIHCDVIGHCQVGSRAAGSSARSAPRPYVS